MQLKGLMLVLLRNGRLRCQGWGIEADVGGCARIVFTSAARIFLP